MNKHYYYVALSRARTLLGLSMAELLEVDQNIIPRHQLVCTTLTWLYRHYKLGCGMLRPGTLPVSEVAGLKQELVVAQGLHVTLILRLAEDLQRSAHGSSPWGTPRHFNAATSSLVVDTSGDSPPAWEWALRASLN